MGISKQEFYEGAALHRLARAGAISELRFEAPFFLLNGSLLIYLKHCTKGRSPWSFTFTKDEQSTFLKSLSNRRQIIIGLICGSDGVVALPIASYQNIASWRKSSVHISCYRERGQYYEVNGPDGTTGNKVAPSMWERLLLEARET